MINLINYYLYKDEIIESTGPEKLEGVNNKHQKCGWVGGWVRTCVFTGNTRRESNILIT